MDTNLTKNTSDSRASVEPVTERHFALIGGWRRTDSAPAPDRAVSVAVIGGAKLDLSCAAIPADGTTITQVSLIGGVDLTVAPGTRVVVDGFNVLGGRRVDLGHAPSDAPVVRVRSFSLVGGVRAHHSNG